MAGGKERFDGWGRGELREREEPKEGENKGDGRERRWRKGEEKDERDYTSGEKVEFSKYNRAYMDIKYIYRGILTEFESCPYLPF